jgi:hypothetical protein
MAPVPRDLEIFAWAQPIKEVKKSSVETGSPRLGGEGEQAVHVTTKNQKC